MTRLGDLVAEAIARDGDAVERAVFGTGEPGAIAALIEDACATAVGEHPVDAIIYAASVGCVSGLRLAGGREVAIKVLPARYSAAFLEAVRRVQTHLARSGFPCPAPIAGPLPVGAGRALVETLLADPGWRAPDASTVTVSAAGLADVVHRCEGVDPAGLSPHPLDAVSGLYPEPHSPIFDFDATSSGAEWIDDLARAGRAVRDATESEPVIAHTDWSARNVRFAATDIVAVYDWDSLAFVPETTVVGQAAATWSAIDGSELAPSADEIAGFARAYENARGRPFTTPERRAIGGAAVWVLAYTARCEHAIDPDERVHRRARPRLRTDASRLLDFG